ncbi:MAG: exosortase/archaeosortase family protein [Phycisphaeraceae bacterium]
MSTRLASPVPPSAAAMSRQACLAAVLLAGGAAATLHVWADIVRIVRRDDEASHVMLVPIVVAWLLWVRRDRWRSMPITHRLAGPAIILAGGAISWFGFNHAVQWLWHMGAIILMLGCLVTALGTAPLRRFAPAFLALILLAPVPGLVRQQVALPLQAATAQLTQSLLATLGFAVTRAGNLLSIHGQPVNIGEACNGMRMMLGLLLVSYGFAFVMPLRTTSRIAILAASPLIAIACNILRLAPIVLLHGYADGSVAGQFHDVSSWLMVPAAFGLLMLVTPRGGNLKSEIANPTASAANAKSEVSPESQDPNPAEPTGDPRGALGFGASDSVRISRLGFRASIARAGRHAPVLALVFLALIGALAWTRPGAADAEPFHQRVRTAVLAVPQQIDGWRGVDYELPTSAVAMLKPNAWINRAYVNDATGEAAGLSVIQCRDARDMVGHFPPICFTAHGWVEESHRPITLDIAGSAVPATEYVFAQDTGERVDRLIVLYFAVLPDGQCRRDLAGIESAAADYNRYYLGAGQVQFVFDQSVTPPRRSAIATELLNANGPLLAALGSAKVQPESTLTARSGGQLDTP